MSIRVFSDKPVAREPQYSLKLVPRASGGAAVILVDELGSKCGGGNVIIFYDNGTISLMEAVDEIAAKSAGLRLDDAGRAKLV